MLEVGRETGPGAGVDGAGAGAGAGVHETARSKKSERTVVKRYSFFIGFSFPPAIALRSGYKLLADIIT